MQKSIFRDKNGKLVVVQAPNLPLWLWLVATLLSKIVDDGTAQQVFFWVAFISLAVWAILELVSGSSIFRRILGFVVLFLAVNNRF